MKRASKTKSTVSAESLARLAEKGQDISTYFTNKGKVMPPLEKSEIGSDKKLEEFSELAREIQETDLTRQHRHNPDHD
jgi:hypothetical protein